MRFTVYAIAVFLAYGVMVWRGVDLLPTTSRGEVPPHVRNSPGGYRTYHSFYSFHGGK